MVDSHASHAQNTNDGKLCLSLHVQFGDEEDGQKADGEITQCGESTVDVGHDDDDVDIDAGTLDARVLSGPGPKVRDRFALQK